VLGFKSELAAAITLAGIELVHMMRKQQGQLANSVKAILKKQFAALAA
jgi:transposase-like protein